MVFAVLAAPVGHAAALPNLFAGCADQQLERPFLPWLDPAQYVLAPNGGFEWAGGWRLEGGARVVAGNESFSVRSPDDRRSLALPSGGSATSSWMCVSLEHPTLRFFARNGGPVLSTLRVEVLFRDVFGSVRALPVSVGVAGRSWQPTLPTPYLVNVPAALLPRDGGAAVAFRFVPQGPGAAWQVDDIYVDPFRGR
jgi:hypothetical protein